MTTFEVDTEKKTTRIITSWTRPVGDYKKAKKKKVEQVKSDVQEEYL